MYLEKIQATNFRSFQNAEVNLRRDLTVFVGENNSGKSNAIDSIRLITSPLSGRRELYAETGDIRFGAAAPRFEIEAHFRELNPAQQGRLISAAQDLTLQNVRFGITYDSGGGVRPTKPSLWGGKFKTTPEPGSHDMVRHVYLPPLRDAKRALASGNPTRILALLRHFLGDEKPETLAGRLGRKSNDPVLSKVDEAVTAGLSALTIGVRRQAASVGFSDSETLVDIARDLRFRLADHGIEPEDLQYSGHGYANLLYMATIAVELEKAEHADLTLFLVEEPEAHLHPQLQAAVLGFLEEQAAKSRALAQARHGPSGEVQVVVATHSPNLSAWVASDKIVYFRSLPSRPSASAEDRTSPDSAAGQLGTSSSELPREHSSDARSEAPEATALPVRRATQCIPLALLNMSEEDRRKIDRYLDVTKSALLFGGRILLVEGIAESLLIPVIAKHHVLKGKQEKLRFFRSAVFVAIDGVDFEPYVRLLLTPHKGARIADRVVVVTDGDRGAATGSEPPGVRRKLALEALALELGASESLSVLTNSVSLEPELLASGNESILRQVYLSMHPDSAEKWDKAVASSDSEDAVREIFRSVRKGDFAQILSQNLEAGAPFIVPDYIARAIERIVE